MDTEIVAVSVAALIHWLLHRNAAIAWLRTILSTPAHKILRMCIMTSSGSRQNMPSDVDAVAYTTGAHRRFGLCSNIWYFICWSHSFVLYTTLLLDVNPLMCMCIYVSLTLWTVSHAFADRNLRIHTCSKKMGVVFRSYMYGKQERNPGNPETQTTSTASTLRIREHPATAGLLDNQSTLSLGYLNPSREDSKCLLTTQAHHSTLPITCFTNELFLQFLFSHWNYH